jgi:hypothetical protein
MRLLLIPLFLLTLLSPAYSQDLAKAKLTYKEQLAEITVKHDVARAQLKSAFLKALTALTAKYQAAGNLTALRAAEGAANAVNSDTIPGPTGTPLVDRNLAVYSRKASTIDHTQDQAIARLNAAYKKRLGELITDLTKAGKIDEAKAVEFELKAFTEMTPNQPRASTDKTPTSQTPVKYKGHRYLFIPEKVTWEEALALAVKKHGHLVYINDAKENEFILDYVGQRSSSIWLGAEFFKERLDGTTKSAGNGINRTSRFGFGRSTFGQKRGPTKRLGERHPGSAKTQARWNAPTYQEPLKFWPKLYPTYTITYTQNDRLCMVCKAARDSATTGYAPRSERNGGSVYGHGKWHKSGENTRRHAVIEWEN